MMTVRRSKKRNVIKVIIFKNDAHYSKTCPYVALFQKFVDTPVMVVHLFFALTVSIIWRLLFPTLCWFIYTKSMAKTMLTLLFVFLLFLLIADFGLITAICIKCIASSLDAFLVCSIFTGDHYVLCNCLNVVDT
jgi:hypothetical protein